MPFEPFLHFRSFGILPFINNMQTVPVVDVFAGAGGLSEGFASWPSREESPFRIALSAEKDPAAIRTLRLRAFFRQFSPDAVPDTYYRFIRGESVEEEFRKILAGDEVARYRCREPANCERVYAAAIGEGGFSHTDFNRQIVAATNGGKYWVLIGGLPASRSPQRGGPGGAPYWGSIPRRIAGIFSTRSICGSSPSTGHQCS